METHQQANNLPTMSGKFKQSRFYKFFEKKIDWKEEKRVANVAKTLMYVLILAMQLVLFVTLIADERNAESDTFSMRLVMLLVASGVLSISNAMRLFWSRGTAFKIGCFALEMLALVVMIVVTGSTTLVFLYILILTGFYISAKRPLSSILVLAVAIPVYLVSYWLTMTFWSQGEEITSAVVVSESVWALVALVAHFFATNFALGFYRQYLKLDNALTELDRSRSELQKAYDSLAEATVLEERQRIAKEIHDTAGHSITTVIMQTEAARLVIDKNPDDAKMKLVAANLQAKHALEELRESVHVLSGNTTRGTLKMEMTKIVEESSAGTGIIVRYEIDDLAFSPAKDRFLCNTLKECISNGIRHGKATAFWVELKREGSLARLLVSDNGCGVDLERLQKGFGLTGMMESTERFGGSVELASELGDGLEIAVLVPMDEPKMA